MIRLFYKNIQMFKFIIEYTKKWKNRNILHLVIGGILYTLISIIFNTIIGLLVTFILSNIWEINQIKYYKAKYSLNDIILSNFIAIIVTILFNIKTS